MDFETFILTDAGRALLTKVMKGSCKLTLTSFNIGAGTFTEEDVPALTALKDQRASFSFGTVTDLQDGTGVHVTVTVSNIDAKEDYTWTESAIMANDPDAGTILYAAACSADGSGEKITAYNGSYPVLVTEDVMTGIDDAANVEITVNLSQYLTQTDADRLYAPIKTNYTKIEVNALLDKKADKATTLSGYNIADAYTKTQTDDLLAKKASASHTHTKSQITDFPTALSAFTNDEGFKKISWTTVTISSSAWNNLTSSVAIAAVTADNAVDVTPAPPQSNIDIWIKAQMYASAQAAGTLTFACKTAPTESVTVNVKCTTAV